MYYKLRWWESEVGGEFQVSLGNRLKLCPNKSSEPQSWAWWLIPGISGLWRLRKRNCHSWDSNLQNSE